VVPEIQTEYGHVAYGSGNWIAVDCAVDHTWDSRGQGLLEYDRDPDPGPAADDGHHSHDFLGCHVDSALFIVRTAAIEQCRNYPTSLILSPRHVWFVEFSPTRGSRLGDQL